MTAGQATWTKLCTLARRARLAGATRQRMEVHLSPEQDPAWDDVLEATLLMTTALMSRPELHLSEPTAHELAYLAMQGGTFGRLADEPNLYSDDDLKERFEWATA